MDFLFFEQGKFPSEIFFTVGASKFHFVKNKKKLFLEKYKNVFNLGARKFHFPKYKKVANLKARKLHFTKFKKKFF